MSTPKQQYYENLADSLIDKFNLRGIEGYYCETKEEALLTAKRFLTPGCSVSWGGSMTLEEIGAKFDLTRERVRQIKEKAIRRLKGQKSRLLKTYLGN